MSADVKVPQLAESIADATLVEWLKPDGAPVRVDEPVATLETDKAAVEIAATETGTLRHARAIGDVVRMGDVLARIEPGAVAAAGPAPAPAAPASRPDARVPGAAAPVAAPAPTPAPAPATASAATAAPAPAATATSAPAPAIPPMGPAARRMAEEHGIDPSLLSPTGPRGRVLKEDVARAVATPAAPPPPAAAPASPAPPAPATAAAPAAAAAPPAAAPAGPGERVVPMSRIRKRIAERLVEAQRSTASLTTFNEVDMSAIVDLRHRRRASFEQKHGLKLGLTSFFARASIQALAEIPELNAEIRGDDIVYHDQVNLAVAVQTDRGLVVPVIHRADALCFVDIEREIARLAAKARDHRLSLDDLAGGTFTVTNGGIFGSLFATPILNPPQSGILGMHRIEKRPVVVNEEIAIRPMMYVALSYDHRIVDGEQSVTFLVKVKERLEDPERLLLDI